MNHDDATRLFYAHIWPQRAMVLRTARFMARDHAVADDLAQETMVKAFKNMERFDVSSNARAWVAAILRNTWIDHLRAGGRAGAMISVEQAELDVEDKSGGTAVAELGDPGAMLEQFSDGAMIKALKALPEEIRWTLLLVDVEGMEQAAAGEILGVPEGTVKSRAFRGRRMLREILLAADGSSKEDGL